MSQKDTPTATRQGKAKKNPCGNCQDECNSGNAVVCGFCELWSHVKCIDGMTPEFIKCCDAMNKYYGGSSFLCVVCRKVTGMLNQSMKDMEARMKQTEALLKTAELERKVLTEKFENLESRNRQVGENVKKIEVEVTSGMEKAKEEVKDEMRDETREREEKRTNIVVYGMKESKEAEGEKRKEDDEEMVKKMVEEIGVQPKGEFKVRYRAGKKMEGERPRPMVIMVEDDETRESIMANARKLSGKDEWKRVFVSPDLTWRQREELKKEEKKLQDDAERRTEELKKEEKEGKYVVVGQRGRRWVKWVRERRDD